MMKWRTGTKRILALMLTVILLLTAGCGGKKTTVETLNETNVLPEDGIITKEQFETVAGESKEIQFTGEADGSITYTWEFDASHIKNPQDQNLKIGVDTEALDVVKEKAADAVNAVKLTMEGTGLISAPKLTIKVPGIWEANSASLVKEENNSFTEIAEVAVTKDESANVTALSMNLVSKAETCYIIGKMAAVSGDDGAENNTTDQTNTTADSSTTKEEETTKEEKKSETTTAKKSETTTAKKNETTTAKKNETTEAKKKKCTISISCATILNNMDNLEPEKKDFVPKNGWILKKTTVTFEEGESVHDVLKRVCRSKGIHMESSYTPIYDSAYVEGINQLYEFDCGSQSGWMYKVNGWFPNYGCSRYKVSEGDDIAWVYTCDLGADVGDNSMQ